LCFCAGLAHCLVKYGVSEGSNRAHFSTIAQKQINQASFFDAFFGLIFTPKIIVMAFGTPFGENISGIRSIEVVDVNDSI